MSEQLTLDHARGADLKRQGLDTVEVFDGNFVEYMRGRAIQISLRSGFVSSDNLRVIADELGMKPKHPNSWGAIFRGPKWRIVGRQQSRVPGNHCREIKIWQYTGGA